MSGKRKEDMHPPLADIVHFSSLCIAVSLTILKRIY